MRFPLPAGGSRLPTSLATVAEGQHYIHMNGREVYRFATKVMSQATLEAVEKANLKWMTSTLLSRTRQPAHSLKQLPATLTYPWSAWLST